MENKKADTREFVKKLARPGEVIPEFTKHIAEKVPALTKSQRNWAKSVADGIANIDHGPKGNR